MQFTGRNSYTGEIYTELHVKNASLSSQVELGDALIDKLSVDVKTGILTYNTQLVLFERMLETGLLEEMQGEGYHVEMLVFDMDKLKVHNELGDHEGGNIALATVIERLQPLYRRRSDIVAGFLQHDREARAAVRDRRGFMQLSRFERGDEIIGMSFKPPNEGDSDRRHPLLSLDTRAMQIVEALQDTQVTYLLRSGKSPAEIDREFGSGLAYAVDERGQVTASVSGTFALAIAPIPVSMSDFEQLFADIDHAMGNAKRSRQHVTTQGVTLNLLPITLDDS